MNKNRAVRIAVELAGKAITAGALMERELNDVGALGVADFIKTLSEKLVELDDPDKG